MTDYEHMISCGVGGNKLCSKPSKLAGDVALLIEEIDVVDIACHCVERYEPNVRETGPRSRIHQSQYGVVSILCHLD
jgi:hypothetical protein